MNFGNKLKDWRERLRDRHMFTVVITSLLIIAALGGYILKVRNDNKQSLENRYNHAFYELASYMENIDTLLAKAQISRDPVHGAKTMSELWRQSNLAQTNLSSLPIEQDVIGQTSKFLSQTSDFSYSLAMQTIEQTPFSTEQLNQIASLSAYANKLQNAISSLSAELNQGRLHWNEISRKGTAAFKQVSSEDGTNAFEQISKNFQNYPGLIYDGPFSSHITDIQPKGITGASIDGTRAGEIAKNFFGPERVSSIESTSESLQANIPAFSINLKLTTGENAYLDISKVGGHVIYMIYNKNVTNRNLDINQAMQKAQSFLTSRGFNSMESTYYMDQNNIVTINFAYKQDNVTVYPDLIKVQVALDTGEIVGFESAGYLFSHTTRKITTPKISAAQAKNLLNKKLELVSSGLAIIPTKVKTEVLVYEFKGKVEDRQFIVYINADTGKEEDILIVLNTPNGILTI